ncbi:myb-like protein X isoform X2 [Mytilus californianus]|uniref:myb-like protein X isoform X2 n=1 Tax=Mytilus californianus TaxID=6549 RepID=UPI002247EB75|nr:myb-like protein X isoform X2 [Mytilus californianus]
MSVIRKMTTLSSFRWWFIILQISCCKEMCIAVSTTTIENSTGFHKGTIVMYFSAGFMTASLIFSIGCFVSKCKTPQRKDDDAENAELVDKEDQVFASAPGNEYVNEESCESDQKSYAYCHIDTDQKSTDDFSQSSTSKKRYNHRESYDFVDHNRIKSSLLNDTENPNPYNHVTVDMEVTEYDNASFLKPRNEVMDPTYSHLSEVKLQNENPSLTTDKGDKGKLEHRSMDETNNSSNKENKKQKTSEKEKQKKPDNKKEKKPEKEKENQKQKKLEKETQKQKKPEIEKQKQKNPEKDKVKQKNQQKENQKPKTQEKEALKQKKPESKEKMENKKEQSNDKLQTAMETGEYQVINNCVNAKIGQKTDENDNENENSTEDNKLIRHKFGYSFVQKKKSIPNEESADKTEGSKTFDISCDQDDNSYQFTSSSEESNENSEVSTESNSRESSVPIGSDETSGNSGSETETDNLLPPAMAINILYEDVSVAKGNVVIGPIDETSEPELESQEEDADY